MVVVRITADNGVVGWERRLPVPQWSKEHGEPAPPQGTQLGAVVVGIPVDFQKASMLFGTHLDTSSLLVSASLARARLKYRST